ncbi:hypothetical protein pqer_cds_64 [Pandoravirus quercus]|uniref:Uncharacterized protein n=1 Tax=Pandoravirus quercus TaxID=2107709 RepID=A0A2U7U7T7_9VIRU|nr:hypothetical protein pqer_cds_64 [Pandoravirus quercus]AVK74486.1 hypothetical protein pqer_cds_64 [Pandoravirus quercus]
MWGSSTRGTRVMGRRAKQSAGRPPSSVRAGLLLVCATLVFCWEPMAAHATRSEITMSVDTENNYALQTAAGIESGLSPLDPTDGPCESLIDDEVCYRRCGCEWCGAGQGHGCHTIPAAGSTNTTGPCAGGKPGRRDAFWSCHREAVAWIAGGIVGAAATAFLIVVGTCWCHRKKVAARCCAWRRRRQGNLHNHARINDAAGDVWLGGYVSMPRYVNP